MTHPVPGRATLVGLTALLVLARGGPAAAQGPGPAIRPGDHIRLSVPCQATSPPTEVARTALCPVTGRLVSSGSDSLVLSLAEATVGYSWSAVRGLEVSRGYRSHRLVGAGAGFVVGAGVTYLVLNSGGSTSLCDRSANQDAISSAECLGLTAAGGLAGAGVGILIGGLLRSERWQPVSLDQVRLGRWGETGWRVAVSVAF